MTALLPYLPTILGALTAGGSALAGSRQRNEPMTRFEKMPTMSGEQQSLLNQLLAMTQGSLPQIQSQLQSLIQGQEQPFEKYAKRQFQEEISPQIAEQFAGRRSSSAFNQAMARASESLAENLAGLRAQQQQGAFSLFQNLLGTGLSAQPFAYQPIQRGKTFGETFLPALGGFGAQLFGQGLGENFPSQMQSQLLKALSQNRGM